MDHKKKSANYSNKHQIAKLLLTNLGTCILSIGVCICLTAALCYQMDLDETIMYYFTYPMIALCAFLNGFVMARKLRVKGWMVGLVSNLLFLLAIVAAHFIVGERTYETLFLLKTGLIILCGLAGGIVGVNKKRKIR